jgi:hypothetical protein
MVFYVNVCCDGIKIIVFGMYDRNLNHLVSGHRLVVYITTVTRYLSLSRQQVRAKAPAVSFCPFAHQQ